MAAEAPSFLLSIRFLLALIAFLAYATQYTQKINMSVAIVCMINNTALEAHNPTHPQSHMSTVFDNSSVTNGVEQSKLDSCDAGGNSKKKSIVKIIFIQK